MAAQGEPVRLFYSYSHKDEDLLKKLQEHLAPLRWNGQIAEWHDRNIDAGEEWAKEIDRNLMSADIILLLISASFLASRYCWSVEMTKALERHGRGEARVIPVILKPCRWTSSPFASLQATPKDGKAITSWPNQDEAFDDVAAEIERVVAETRQRRKPAVDNVSVGVKPSALPDLAVFRDIEAPWCPEMVVIPAGSFLMGSPPGEEGRSATEGPQHRVTIGYRFALGRYPVTFAEYDHFCAATKQEKPGDAGWGRGRRPVIDVSWQDAVAYSDWLVKETGQPYRLPSEAEWEYACRAGTVTPYSSGNVITPEEAIYSLSKHGRTTEVGAYPANPWGLCDMHGNVWERVEDVWHDSYQGAPVDGSVWTGGEGKESYRLRVVRGGSWNNAPGNLRSASRIWFGPDYRVDDGGFRVARTVF